MRGSAFRVPRFSRLAPTSRSLFTVNRSRSSFLLLLNSPLVATRVLRRDTRGSSSPVVVETGAGQYFVKLRGAAQGTAALVAEVLVAELADRIGLPVPDRRVVVFEAGLESNDRNDELADLLAASRGENLGFKFLPAARPFVKEDLGLVTPDFAAQVRWLDWLVMNPDRSPANPNLMVEGKRLWLIDHGAALPFQHDWEAVTAESPLRPPPKVPHLLAGIAADVAGWDELLTPLFTPDSLAESVAAIPDSFLRPLLTPGTDLAARREAYRDFLWQRLSGPHAFE